MTENKNVYINSFQASDIYEHQLGKPIGQNFVGMIPYSLELIKLREFGLKVFQSKTGKNRTYDIINIEFKYKVSSAEDLLSEKSPNYHMNKMLELGELSNKLKTKTEQKKNDFQIAEHYKKMKFLERAKKEMWDEISANELRRILYRDGFTYNGVDYVVYKRTSAKSRVGKCQFIRKSLKNKALRWARMGMNLEGLSLDDGVDFPSLLAYESLVSSSIVDTMYIHPDNIFVISDVISKFTTRASVIKNDEETGKLISEQVDNHSMESDIFDGQSLLDSSYFTNGKGSVLLRNHMFKSCAFNANIKEFLIDYCPDDIKFDDWKLQDMFGNEVFAKDVHMIATPNSLKALKFYKRKKTKKGMYEHWKNKVIEDKCLFGIVKYEKESKRGYDDGKILNQTSYQILNSMPYSYDDMVELSKFEIEYINSLKNDDEIYIEYLVENSNEMNTNSMLADIYMKNKNVANTMLFKNKRKSDINAYVKKVKKGKVRISGDYCVICQNPKEMLYHSIGLLPVNDGVLTEDVWEKDIELKKNQCHAIMHEFGREYPSFRNPHTSPSNVLILDNVGSDFIKKYMNPTNNIIYTNAIGFEINRILSGQDVDSDTTLILDNTKMLEVAKKCFGNYRVCDNNISAVKMDYSVSDLNMAKIDNILSTSQTHIGTVVNNGQHCMSAYWEYVYHNGVDEKSKELLNVVDVCTVLSEVAIDMAKKMYNVDFKSETKSIENDIGTKVKPKFFKYVSKNKNIKTEFYKTPMDYLYQILDKIDRAESRETIPFEKIIKHNTFKLTKKRKKQRDKIHSIINNYILERQEIFSRYSSDDEETREERFLALDDALDKYTYQIKKYKITDATIYHILLSLIDEDLKTREILTYMDIMYKINKEEFLSIIK